MGKLWQVFICRRPRTPYSPPYTLFTCIQYTYSHRGGGEGELNQRKGKKGNKGNRSQRWVENTNMTECSQEIGYLQSINSDKHHSLSTIKGQFFG
jgi:hypothetical protein